MDKGKVINDVLRQIEANGIADDILEALTAQKEYSFDLYYDEQTKEPVGVIYQNIVFLKETSAEKMKWHEAEAYCSTVVVNGIAAELCPSLTTKEGGAKVFLSALREALAKIGATHLDETTWGESYSERSLFASHLYAWTINFKKGFSSGCKYDYQYHVRPVLRLKK